MSPLPFGVRSARSPRPHDTGTGFCVAIAFRRSERALQFALEEEHPAVYAVAIAFRRSERALRPKAEGK